MIAFSYAFFYLRENYTYEQAVKNILSKGGDTDTNAAIVGGLLGARWGFSNIPEEWRTHALRFDNPRKVYTELEDFDELVKVIDQLIDKI